MGNMAYIKLYLITVPVFFLIDMLWLGVVAKGFYRHHLGGLLSTHVRWGVAITFYLVYIVGILIFVVVPALSKDAVGKAILMGTLFGFFTYATYDLTNLATLRGWPITIVAVDILWGSFLCATVSLWSFYAGKWLGF